MRKVLRPKTKAEDEEDPILFLVPNESSKCYTNPFGIDEKLLNKFSFFLFVETKNKKK